MGRSHTRRTKNERRRIARQRGLKADRERNRELRESSR